RLRIREILDQFAVLRRPRRRACGQARPAGDVRIHVRLDVHTGAARRVDLGDGLRSLCPIAGARGLEVVDLDWYTALRTDADRFVDRLQQLIGLGAHMSYINSAVGRHRL